MTVNTKNLVSITEANQNFSRVARLVDENGAAVILKNNVPRYVLLEFSQAEREQLAEDEDVLAVSRRLIAKKMCIRDRAVFFLTESLFPLCSDQLTIEVVLQSLGVLFCCSVLAGLMGVIALWFGFRKKSVSVTIVTSVILATIVCQLSLIHI